MIAPVTIVHAQAYDLPGIHNLLAGLQLPYGDVNIEIIKNFYVGRTSLGVVACAGLQVLDESTGLLRSLGVVPNFRHGRIGARLVESIENIARQRQLRALWLLTTDSAPFFERRGYRAVERETAPAAVRASSQFVELCAADATLMVKEM